MVLGQFDIRGVNVLDVVVIVLLLGAARVVLTRGRGATWAARAAAGLGLLALTRLGGVLAFQWLLWEQEGPLIERARLYSWIQAGLSLANTVGLVLLVVAVLTGRRTSEPATPPAPYSGAQAG